MITFPLVKKVIIKLVGFVDIFHNCGIAQWNIRMTIYLFMQIRNKQAEKCFTCIFFNGHKKTKNLLVCFLCEKLTEINFFRANNTSNPWIFLQFNVDTR